METHRTCMACQGTGYIRIAFSEKVMLELTPALDRAPMLRQRIMLVVQYGKYTAKTIEVILTTHDHQLDPASVEYNLLNMEEEGILVYDNPTGRYTQNTEPYEEDD